MSWAGTVLSQPPSRTTASIGWARIISSTSIDMRLRNFRLVGLRNTSPREMVGNSIGRAPAAKDAALHRLDHFRKVAVAVVEAAGRMGDADDRPVQHLAAIAHGTREGAPQIKAEITVAVVGETPPETVSVPFVCHFILPDLILSDLHILGSR